MISSLNKAIIYVLTSTLITCSSITYSQNWIKLPNPLKKSTELVISSDEIQLIKDDITFLASNHVAGRKSGSKQEEAAGMFLEKRMNVSGLKPIINNSYRQHFKFESDKKLSKDCKMTIGNSYLFIPEDAIPLAFSNIKNAEESFIMPLSEEPASPWVIPLYNDISEAKNPDFDWEQAAYLKALKAQRKGASAVILFDEYGAQNRPSFKKNSPFDPLDILVIIVQKHAYDKYIKNIKTITPIAINIEYTSEKLVGTNIVGYLNNNANKTIVIGAHYDHLGENPLGRAGTYFPGADNNASGVAAMLALASRIAKSDFKNYNFIFVAFSAYENGMMGSKAFLKNLPIPQDQIACMISLDRVGKLKNNKKFFVEGMGSALAWNEILQNITLPTPIGVTQTNKFNINSEHIDFYAHSIPSILVTTGKNEVHGTMNDMVVKLNFEGITTVTNYTLQLIQKINAGNYKFQFQKIRNTQTTTPPNP